MRIAIPIWNGRVSPVFDVAKRLLIVEVEYSAASVLEEKTVETEQLIARAQYLSDLGIEILICGAISKPLQMCLESSGVKVISHICGLVEEVVKVFIEGRLQEEKFMMPGCTVSKAKDQFEAGQLATRSIS